MGRTRQAGGKRAYRRTDYVHRVATVARVCRRMATGESVSEICRDPTLPALSTLLSWLKRHPELGAEVERARGEWPEAHRVYHRYSDEVATEFLERIADGRGLREVCASPDMPVHATVLRWMGERPEFARRYALARQAQADRLFDLAWRIACEAGEDEVKTARLKISTLKWRVGKLAPRRYGAFKAVEPPAAPGGGGAGGEGGEPKRILFEIRDFAVRPDGRVADITTLARGLRGEALQKLYDDVKSGRVEVPPAEERDW